MDKIKTRLEELEDMLMPDGDLNRNIYNAVIKIRNAKETNSKFDIKLWEELDNSLNRFVKYCVEYDRLKGNR
jgi:hypothetical protein